MSLRSVLLPVVLIASPLSAQGSRIAVGPFGAYRWGSSLYEHRGRSPGLTPESAGTRHQEWLRIEGSSLAGARMEYRVRPSWRVFAEGAYGRADFEFHEGSFSGTPTNPGSGYEIWVRGDATIVSLAMGVARQFQLRAGGPAVEMSVGGALDRTRLDKSVCPPPRPSSTGFIAPCHPSRDVLARVEPRYDVPSVTSAVAVRQQVHRRVEIRTGARYAYGRADTRSMRVDAIPGFYQAGAPTSRWFGVPQLSAGATMTF